MSHKAENTSEYIVLIDPVKSFLVGIQFIQRFILSVQMKQILYPVLHLLMRLLSKQIPVKFPLLTPLSKLRKILSHKQKLLSGMSDHKRISGFQIGKLIKSEPRHLIDHRTFQMYDLIMRQYENIILTVRIFHRECHHIVRILSE